MSQGSSDARLGLRLQHAREARGLTQAELAARAGYSQSAVAGWESGRRSCRVETLERLAAAMDVPLADLVLPAGAVSEGEPAPYRIVTAPDERLERAILRAEVAAERLEALVERMERLLELRGGE